VSNWIQEAIKHPGGLRKQLRRLGLIKGKQKIPADLLNKIAKASVGTYITYKGTRFMVTELLKKRAVLAKTLRKLRRKKKKRKGRRNKK